MAQRVRPRSSMERTWSTDSVASIPEKSLPGSIAARKAARRLSNQASVQGAREWKKARAHPLQRPSSIEWPSQRQQQRHVNNNHSYSATNANAGPSSRADSVTVGPPRPRLTRPKAPISADATSSTQPPSPSRPTFVTSVTRTASTRPPRLPCALFPWFQHLEVSCRLGREYSGSSTDGPTRRYRSNTATSKKPTLPILRPMAAAATHPVTMIIPPVPTLSLSTGMSVANERSNDRPRPAASASQVH